MLQPCTSFELLQASVRYSPLSVMDPLEVNTNIIYIHAYT